MPYHHNKHSRDLSNRDKYFSSNYYLVLAAVGAAVGLGNFWRFPFVALDNGGGSFLIPYILVTFCIGLPILIFEFGIGKRYGKSIPFALEKVLKRNSLFGWFIGLNCFIIVCYYTVILAWSLLYFFGAFKLSWRDNPTAYFNENILGKSEGVWQLGNLQFKVILALIVIWLIIFWITSGRIRRLEKTLNISVFFPIIAMLILLVRAVSLPGAGEGLLKFVQPDFSKLFNVNTWAAALTQVLLSLSIGMGQIVAYSARRKKQNVKKNGILVAAINTGFSILAGVTVFATMGYFVQKGNLAWESLQGGPGLAFIAYPTVIAMLPAGAHLIGIIFFLMIILLGLDSAFAAIEANMKPVEERTGLNRRKISFLFCGSALVLGILFTTSAGIYWLEIVDHLVAYYGVLIAVLVECLIIGFKGNLDELIWKTGNKTGLMFKVWKTMVKLIIPVILVSIIITSLWSDISKSYANYPHLALLLGTIGVGLIVGIGSKVLSSVSRKKSKELV